MTVSPIPPSAPNLILLVREGRRYGSASGSRAEKAGSVAAANDDLNRTPPVDAGNGVSRRSWLRGAFAGGIGVLLPGCGYMVGQSYSPELRTVSVPIFENVTFRRGIEFQLTEAVQKEITRRTPYRLARGAEADTRLTGKIVDVRKDVLGETAQDDPRELQVTYMVRVSWEDLRNGQILAQQEVPIAPADVPLVGQAEMAPEVGQSLATATQDAVDRLARRIVDMMEVPW